MAPEEFISIARERVDHLGVYRLRFTKEELVKGKWIGPQVMELTIREKPYAVNGLVLSGPNKGRKFHYDQKERKSEVQVREAGILGALPLWLDINNPLTRGDTNHPVTELGYSFVLRMIERDEERSRSAGGFTRVNEPPDCVLLTAPTTMTGFYAPKVRLCFDMDRRLLKRVEIWDEKGKQIERFQFELLEERAKDPF